MCGIHVVISSSEPGEIPANLHRCLCNRGPDHILTHRTLLNDAQDHAPTTNLAFTSTVLALRGDHVAQQPFVDSESGSVFCWNGEAWKIRHHDVAGNDGEVVAGLLSKAIAQSSAEREGAILKVLRSIDGPFAFVFFDKPSMKLYFGRDRLGRRSLLVREDAQGLILSSIADSIDSEWKEVEADGVYVVDLASRGQIVNGMDEVVRVTTRLQWLEGEDAEHFVSTLQQASNAPIYRDNTVQLTPLGFCYWDVQRLNASWRSNTAGTRLDFGPVTTGPVDKIAQVARLERAHTACHVSAVIRSQSGHIIFWRP